MALLAVLNSGGAGAYAFFTAGGSATGEAVTGELTPVVIQPATTGTLASTLSPGSTADLIVTVQNPNAFPVTVLSVEQGGGVTVSGGSGCTSDPAWPGTLGNSGVSVQTTTGLSVPVGAGATVTFHLATAAAMDGTSDSGCQGATFQIPVTVTVQQ